MPKAVGNAVVRNGTKRRLRALVSARLAGLPTGVDVVVRANATAANVGFEELGDALDRALQRVLTRIDETARPVTSGDE